MILRFHSWIPVPINAGFKIFTGMEMGWLPSRRKSGSRHIRGGKNRWRPSFSSLLRLRLIFLTSRNGSSIISDAHTVPVRLLISLELVLGHWLFLGYCILYPGYSSSVSRQTSNVILNQSLGHSYNVPRQTSNVKLNQSLGYSSNV